ncbi:OsmC family protein [Actinokineospora globicatena]|uniref:OsmC family protein n=1 Tax=Actinokineospora globicatena TaxID=103729 RepID=UPI0020A23719|nr:OsmC family protein [Actinokineospora globicatena]MCP2301558.1 putative OsmC-related protein [Actinokineospora globicatena]GLW76791.1 OsmC family protein [Actinokineospora globicatena]GLW83624.1 OsmC family protein [Actinokineospora globicatena]
MTVETRLNDVNIEAVGALVAAITEDSAKAKTTWASHVTWRGGFQSTARVRAFAETASDEPPALGGQDTAPNPVEQLLSALGNCLAVGYAANATVAGIPLDSVAIDLRGDIDLHVFLGLKQGHAGFDSITAKVRIASPAPAEDIVALPQRVIASSPVGHTLGNAVPVSVELA